MASAHARPMQKRWDDFHVILLVSCGKNKSQNFVMAHQPKEKFPPPPPPKKKKLPANVWEWDANEALCLENLSTWRGMFPEFLTRNFV